MIYYRDENSESEDQDDVWDDTALIKAYDKALSLAYEKILEKIKPELGLTNEEVEEVLSDIKYSRKEEKENSKTKANGVSEKLASTVNINSKNKIIKKKKKSPKNNVNGTLGTNQPLLDLTNEEDGEILGDVNYTGKKKKTSSKIKVNGVNKKLALTLNIGNKNETIKKKKKIPTRNAGNGNWTIGHACRATYSEDGKEYEAKIIKMINEKKCLVKFIGYGNTQKVLLKNLKPSLGEATIELQKLQAEHSEEEGEEDDFEEEEQSDSEVSDSEVSDSEVSDSEVSDSEHKRATYEVQFDPKVLLQESVCRPIPRLSRLPQRPPMVHRLPPPPPQPPHPPADMSYARMNAMGRGAYQNPMASSSCAPNMVLSGDEARNSMMLSWYMCGFYTGYYHRDQVDRQQYTNYRN